MRREVSEVEKPRLPGRDLADLVNRPSAADAGSAAAVPAAAHLLPLVRPLAPGPEGDWLVATINPDYFANQHSLLLGSTPLRATLLSYGGQLLVPAEGSRHQR